MNFIEILVLGHLQKYINLSLMSWNSTWQVLSLEFYEKQVEPLIQSCENLDSLIVVY